jgi:hypothetical protein
MKKLALDEWMNSDAILSCIAALDLAKGERSQHNPWIKMYADILHRDFRSIVCQEAIPSSFELDLLVTWAEQRKLPRKTIKDVNDVLYGEILNLLGIYEYGEYDGNIARAKAFCLMLHRAACAENVKPRRGAAA